MEERKREREREREREGRLRRKKRGEEKRTRELERKREREREREGERGVGEWGMRMIRGYYDAQVGVGVCGYVCDYSIFSARRSSKIQILKVICINFRNNCK